MKAVVQRVSSASVSVGGEIVSSIGKGLAVLIGIHKDDTEKEMEYIVRKLISLRQAVVDICICTLLARSKYHGATYLKKYLTLQYSMFAEQSIYSIVSLLQLLLLIFKVLRCQLSTL